MRDRLHIVKTTVLVVAMSGVARSQEPPLPPDPPPPPALHEETGMLAWMAAQAPPAPARVSPVSPAPPVPPMTHIRVPRLRERDSYSSGQAALDRHEYDRAIDAFNRVIEEKGSRADGALYWRAYAENKLGKRADATATLAELKKNYPGSRWQEDANALEVEVRQGSSSPVSPENASDEDMKILALNSIINSDPERSVPVLEKLLKSNNSPKVKERALFVLAQNSSPASRNLIVQVAKGNYNPDLQAKAVEYLGVYGGHDNGQTLADVYKSTSDVQIKRSILRSFMISNNRAMLLSIAKADSNPELRLEAIRQLSVMGGSSDLLGLYTPDAPIEVRKAILQGLFIAGNSSKILEIARTDKDPAMRREAIRQLGALGRRNGSAVDGLTDLYAKESDLNIRREILNALFMQQNVPSLIAVARKETDPELKREAIRRLSQIHTKEATDFLMEILK